MNIKSKIRAFQAGYVTNDMESAVNVLGERYGIGEFYRMKYVHQVPGSQFGAEAEVALAEIGGLQIEVLRPLDDGFPIYSEWIQVGGSEVVRFHHHGILVLGGYEDWKHYEASLDRNTRPVAFEGNLNEDLYFSYTDDRPLIGHYIEHIWMSPELAQQMESLVPKYN